MIPTDKWTALSDACVGDGRYERSLHRIGLLIAGSHVAGTATSNFTSPMRSAYRAFLWFVKKHWGKSRGAWTATAVCLCGIGTEGEALSDADSTLGHLCLSVRRRLERRVRCFQMHVESVTVFVAVLRLSVRR